MLVLWIDLKSAHSKRNLQRPHLQVRKRRPKGRVSQRFCKRAQAGECIILTHAQTASRAPTACVCQHPPASKCVLSTPLRLSVCLSVCLSITSTRRNARANTRRPARAGVLRAQRAGQRLRRRRRPHHRHQGLRARALASPWGGWVDVCVCVGGAG